MPGGNERFLTKALASEADTLVLDLEDSVPPNRKEAARAAVAEWLASVDAGPKELMVRINPLDTPWGHDDLGAIVPLGPRSMMVPKVGSIADLYRLEESIIAVDDSSTVSFFPVATETARAVVNLPELGLHHRVDGLCWGAEDLSAELGATSARDAAGEFLPVFATVQSWCLLGAASAGVPAIDAVFTDLGDLAGLERESELAAAMGFAGKITVHPDQIDVVNAAFTPSPDLLERASALVAAAELHAEEGRLAFLFDGEMVDAPHIVRAQRLLQRAGIETTRTDEGQIGRPQPDQGESE